MARNLKELRAIALAGVDKRDRVALHDELASIIAECGAIWDLVDGTDARKGPRTKYGTPNHRSMTYKCRKVAGYSYP